MISDSCDAEAEGELHIEWSAIYRSEWDEQPQQYIAAGLLAWNRSRRLAKVHDPLRRFTAYLGVRHFDPVRWNVPGDPTTTYFASFFINRRTIALHTYPSLGDALAAVRQFHASLAGNR